jgi:hypothetical protein
MFVNLHTGLILAHHGSGAKDGGQLIAEREF